MKRDIEAALLQLETDATAGTATAQFRFPADLPIFAGHFPGKPLVPGIYFLEMARTLAERLLSAPLELDTVKDARFTAALLPEAVATTSVSLRENEGIVACDATIQTETATAGKLRLVLRRRAAAQAPA